MPHDDYCIRRVARAHKVKLANRFCQQVLNEVYLDASKVQALQACNNLRKYSRYFMFEPSEVGMTGEQPQVFKFESNQMMENFP
jgi:hypothetical protein